MLKKGNLIKLLIAFMAYHYLIFAVILDGFSVLKLWRDLLIIVLLLISFMRSIKLDIVELIIIVVGFIFFIYMMNAPHLDSAFNIFRVYYVPMLIYFVARRYYADIKWYKGLLKLLLYNATLLSLYGIFQAFVLGPSFLIKLHYNMSGDLLSGGFYISGLSNIQRVASTFSSPNICGMYLLLVFIVCYTSKSIMEINEKKYNICMGIILATIMLTFARTVWLSLGVVLLIDNYKKLFSVKMIAVIWKGLVLIGLAIILDRIFLNSTIYNTLNFILVRTLTGSDDSMISHQSTLNQGMNLIVNNPWGLGLGLNGPRATSFGDANLVESSYFTLIYDIGILGCIVYFLTHIIPMLAIHKFERNKQIVRAKTVKYIVIAILLAEINYPYIQEMEVTIFVFFFLGITANKTLWKTN